MKTCLLLASVLFITSAFTAIGSNTSAIVELSHKEKATALVQSIETGESEPVGYINPSIYIQHNLGVGDGLTGFAEVMATLPPKSARAKVVEHRNTIETIPAMSEWKNSKYGFQVI